MICNGTNAIVYFLKKKKTHTVPFKELIEMTQETLLKYLLRITPPHTHPRGCQGEDVGSRV